MQRNNTQGQNAGSHPRTRTLLEKGKPELHKTLIAREHLPVITSSKSKTSKKRTTRAGAKHKQRGGRNGNGGYRRQRQDVMATWDTIVADETDVVLPWIYEGTLTNVGLAFASVRYQTSGLWDPDPLAGGASFTGLAQWATLYAYYRPISVHYELEIANREAFPMTVYVYHSNGDPGGVVGTAGSYYSENQYGKRGMIGALNGGESIWKTKGNVSFQKLLGAVSLEDDDNFRGVTSSANPLDMFYIGFNTASQVPQTAAGAIFRISLKVRTRLYDRILQT